MSAIAAVATRPCRSRARRRRFELLLALVFSDWWIQGRWPQANDLQKALIGRPGKQFDVLHTAARLPRAYGTLIEGRVVLSIRGLQRVGAAQDALVDFMAAVNLAYKRYGDSQGTTATIGVEELSTTLHLSQRRAERVAQLLDQETSVFAPIVDGGRSAVWEVCNAIYDYRDARTVEQYLAVQRRRSRRRAEADGDRRRRGIRGWFDERELAVKDYLILALLSAVAAAALALAGNHSPLGPAEPARTGPPVTTSPSSASPPRSRGHRQRVVVAPMRGKANRDGSG